MISKSLLCSGKEWEGEAKGANDGLPLGGNRGLAVL